MNIFYGIAIILLALLVWALLTGKHKESESVEDPESLFLSQLIEGYQYWKSEGQMEYAEALKILINRFSQPEISSNE